jgi:hypothetical protein
MTRKMVSDLAQRLSRAARLTPNNTRPEFVEEQWQLVAETIDLMIDNAVLQLKIEILEPTHTGKGAGEC